MAEKETTIFVVFVKYLVANEIFVEQTNGGSDATFYSQQGAEVFVEEQQFIASTWASPLREWKIVKVTI